MRQERLDSPRVEDAIVHSEDTQYILNMHALHNADLIRETLPRHLTAPVPYFHDRRAKHDGFAAELRISGPAKRAETMAKAKATRERNKKAGADAAARTMAPHTNEEVE